MSKVNFEIQEQADKQIPGWLEKEVNELETCVKQYLEVARGEGNKELLDELRGRINSITYRIGSEV